MTDLGAIGGNGSWAYDINDSSQVVGFAENAIGQYHAFLYESGTMRDLGTLRGYRSMAHGINDSGQVVGHDEETGGGALAFLYDSGTMTFLNDLLPSGSGWDDLVEAFDINGNGQIVGKGVIDGKTHAFLMTPNNPVPEPSTLVMWSVFVVIATIYGWRRRRSA